MTTLVGNQTNFEDALQELVELDFDAVEAYEAAIERLDSDSYKKKLNEFKSDHERHIKELNAVLRTHKIKTVDGPSAKKWLTKGKVVLANLIGDRTILAAMLSNELDTNKAYEKVNQHEGKWDDAVDALKKGYADEQKHKKWLEENK